MTAAETAETRK